MASPPRISPGGLDGSPMEATKHNPTRQDSCLAAIIWGYLSLASVDIDTSLLGPFPAYVFVTAHQGNWAGRRARRERKSGTRVRGARAATRVSRNRRQWGGRSVIFGEMAFGRCHPRSIDFFSNHAEDLLVILQSLFQQFLRWSFTRP